MPSDKAKAVFIGQFIAHHSDFFTNDKIINDWLVLLESDVMFDSDSTSVDARSNLAVEPEAPKAEDGKVESATKSKNKQDEDVVMTDSANNNNDAQADQEVVFA